MVFRDFSGTFFWNRKLIIETSLPEEVIVEKETNIIVEKI